MKIIFSDINSPAYNLATEEYLFSQSLDDCLFLYVNSSCVVIGSNQVVQNEVNLHYCELNNIEIMRRISGGGAVYHDLGNLNFSFISNRDVSMSALDKNFLEPIISILHRMNLPVEIGERKDLWIDGRFKISGTASHVGKYREIQHGTLLFDTDIEKLENSLTSPNINTLLKGACSVRSKVQNIKEFFITRKNIRISSEVFFDSFRDHILSHFNVQKNIVFTDLDKFNIQTLADEKFSSKEWVFKK